MKSADYPNGGTPTTTTYVAVPPNNPPATQPRTGVDVGGALIVGAVIIGCGLSLIRIKHTDWKRGH